MLIELLANTGLGSCIVLALGMAALFVLPSNED